MKSLSAAQGCQSDLRQIPRVRITSAFSGRTRASRPVLKGSTGRATRRAADARR